MSICEIAAVLGVSKSYLYGLVKAYPAEKPKLKGDLESWSAFVDRHRIEPIGRRAPRARQPRLEPLCQKRKFMRVRRLIP
jgi:hypothetical protein